MISIHDILKKRGYFIQNEIGSGAFSHCYVVEYNKYKETEFVAKIMEYNEIDNKHTKSCYFNEVSILRRLNHKNIVPIYDHFYEGNFYFLIMENCCGKSVEAHIKNVGPLNNANLKSAAFSLFNALEYLHVNNIAHHDIKPANLLLDKNLRFKLTDFGLSREYYFAKSSNFYSGTLDYMSPEQIMKKEYDPYKADIWAAGVTLYKMASGVSPFKGTSKEETKARIINGLYVPLPPNIDKPITNLIDSCLAIDPEVRPSASRVLDILKEFHLPGLKPSTTLHLCNPLTNSNGIQPLRCLSLVRNGPKSIFNKRKRSFVF